MNSVSNGFKQEMANGNQRYLRFADITLKDGTVLNITNSEIWSGGFKIEEATSSDNVFQIGALVISKLTLILNNMYDDFTDVDFDRAEVVAYVGLELENETVERVRKGHFIVHEASGFNSSLVTLECYDRASLFAKPYSESSLEYPASLGTILRDACNVCEVSLASADFAGNDYVVQNRPVDDKLTFGDIVSDVAQICCKYAKMTSSGQLSLQWYSEFDDSNAHEITSLYSDNIELDDVVITGVMVTISDRDEPEASFYGETGYVLGIENNALIETGKAAAVAKMIGDSVIGLQFRPMSITMVSNPIIEAGDKAYVTDRKGNRYMTYITRNVFSPGSEQEISCEAESPARNSATKYSESTKIYINVRKMLEKHKTAVDVALDNLADRIASSSGYFVTEVTQEDGSKIVYSHNHPTLEESDIIWKETAETRSVSTDGGQTWTAGITADGDAVLRILSAEGINANWITTGAFEVRDDNGNIIFLADKDSNRVYVNSNFVAISKETGETSLNDALDELDSDITKKIETWHQSDDPSLYWTEYVDEILRDHEGNPILDHRGREIHTRYWIDYRNHKGDIWEDTENNIEYYWDGGEWIKTISETKAEAIFKVLDGEIIAQVVAGNIINAINISKESVRIDASTYVDINGVVSANDYFKINLDGSFETIRGKIGNILIDSDKLYTTGHDSINSETAGFMFGADGQISIGDANNYLKFFKTTRDEQETWTADVKLDKLTIELADNLVIGTSRAATKSENDYACTVATNYLYFDSDTGLVVSGTGTVDGNSESPYNTLISTDGIQFRTRSRVMSEINGDGYTLYRPGGTVKIMELNSGGLYFYKNGTDSVAEYTTNGFEVYEGKIGRGDTAFLIDSRSIHNGTLGASNSVWISTGSSDAASIAGSQSISGWALAMGDSFGVTRSGILYARSAELSGKLIAGTNSEIGAWKITDGALTLYETSVDETTGEETTTSVASIGRSGIRIGTDFSVSSAGKLTATGAYISGEVHASDGVFEGTIRATDGYFSGELRSPYGNIGGFTLSDRRLYTGTIGSSGGVYLSPSGFTSEESAPTICGTASRDWVFFVGSNFGVQKDGSLYSHSGNIANWVIGQNDLSSTVGDNSVHLHSGSSSSTKAIQVTNNSTDNFYVTYGGDMVAQKGEIGGIKINSTSLYSDGHTTITNSTAGFIFKNDGEFSIGDGNSYLRFYKDSNNAWKLDIAASALTFGGNTPVTTSTAGNKNWTTQPVPPYKAGDTYTDTTNNQLLYCTTSRDSGSYTASDWSESPASKMANNYIHADNTGLHVSNNGRSYTSGNHIDIDSTNIKFSSGTTTRLNISSSDMTFYRSGTTKAMVLGSTDLTFYDANGYTQAAVLGTNGLEIKKGKIGNITITSDSIYSGEHSSFNSTKTGFYFDENGNFSCYNHPEIGTITYFSFNGVSSALNIKAKNFYVGDKGSEESFIKFTSSGSGMRVGCLSVSTSRVTIKTNANGSGSPVLGIRVDPDTFSDGNDNYKIDVGPSSSKRYKDHVKNMTFEDAKAVLDITPVWFKYKDGYLNEGDEFYRRDIPGFYAEDVEEHFSVGVFHNIDGLVENWDARHIIPAMLMIIKHQQKEIEALKER